MPDHFPLYSLAYASRSALSVDDAHLAKILVGASSRNRGEGVTGVLLYDGITFLQYLEGPDEGIASVFDHIRASKSHRDIRVLHTGHVEERFFPSWSMACRHADPSLIHRLEAARWSERIHADCEALGQESSGLELLSEFCSTAAATPLE